jgi:hypothetical protein
MSNNKMVGNHIKTLREKKNCSQEIFTKNDWCSRFNKMYVRNL